MRLCDAGIRVCLIWISISIRKKVNSMEFLYLPYLQLYFHVFGYSIYSILVRRHFLGDCYVSHAWSTCCCPLSVLIRALCPACR